MGLGLNSDREEAVVNGNESHAIIPKEGISIVEVSTSEKPPRNMGIS